MNSGVIVNPIINMPPILSSLFQTLKQTTGRHKKKIIAFAILAITIALAKKKLKVHHLVNVVMFFFRMSSKIISFLPLPSFAAYRTVLPFSFTGAEFSKENMSAVMNISEVLQKVKKKTPGFLDQLTLTVLSGVILNMILYNPLSLCDLIKTKYYGDFESLGALESFEYSIERLKKEFISSLARLKGVIESEIADLVKVIDLEKKATIPSLKEIFGRLIEHIFQEKMNVHERVINKKRSEEVAQSRSFKISQNLFKTTKQFVETDSEKHPKPVVHKVGSTLLTIITAPVKLLSRTVSEVFTIPEEEVTPLRYYCVEKFYVVTIKQFREDEEWPNKQSKYLFEMVTQELVNWFSSLNFSMLLKKHAEFKLTLFLNRVSLYFKKMAEEKKVTTIKMKSLVSVFYKIVEEELIRVNHHEKFYNNTLFMATKSIHSRSKTDKLQDYHLRNRILEEIYLKNELHHVDRDMQLKFFNERDHIMLAPVARNKRAIEEKDDIEDFLQGFEFNKEINAENNKGNKSIREQFPMTMVEGGSGRPMIREEDNE